MNWPGPALPPPRTSGGRTVIGLRVLFSAAALLSCGLLCWVPLLRLALLRKRPMDWALFVSVLVLAVSSLALSGSAPSTNSWQSNVGTAAILVLAVASTAYFLAVDIGLHSGGAGAAAASFQQPAYPYRQPPAPAHSPVRPPVQRPQPDPSAGYNPYRDTPTPGPAAMPAPPRINQVRAELDELSDYLRKEEGR